MIGRSKTEMLSCREMVELVTDYLEGRLATEDRRRFESHLGQCPGCQAYIDQMRATIDALGHLPPEPPSPEAERELLAAFRDWHAGHPG
jgi:anti-sigma factor RsiW